jgi:hypothetical protein
MKSIIPLGYSKVSDGVSRSAYPADKTLSYVKGLKLKTMVSLCPNDLRPELRTFAEENSIKLIEFEIKFNQEPFLAMSETEVLKIVNFISSKWQIILQVIFLQLFQILKINQH